MWILSLNMYVPTICVILLSWFHLLCRFCDCKYSTLVCSLIVKHHASIQLVIVTWYIYIFIQPTGQALTKPSWPKTSIKVFKTGTCLDCCYTLSIIKNCPTQKQQQWKNNSNTLALILAGLHGPSVNDSNCHFKGVSLITIATLLLHSFFLAGNSGRCFKKSVI